jgi:hypothetical protein
VLACGFELCGTPVKKWVFNIGNFGDSEGFLISFTCGNSGNPSASQQRPGLTILITSGLRLRITKRTSLKILYLASTRPILKGICFFTTGWSFVMTRIVSAFLIGFVLIGLVACGGGSSTPPPTPTPTLAVSPSTANVAVGSSQTFSVPGASSVTWTLTGPGSINSNGVYLAPSAFPGVGNNTAKITASTPTGNGVATAVVVFPNDNSGNQGVPIKLGTSGGNVNDNSTDGKFCCIGTLGSLIQRGANTYILSNNHVLARSTLAKTGELIDQPGQLNCPPGSQGTNVAAFSEQASLKPATSPGPSPSNVDAAIAQIVPSAVDATGAILDLGTAGTTSIGAAPPFNTPQDAKAAFVAGEHVANSGRTTGLTCSTIQSVSTDGISVDYDQSCQGPVSFTATFNGQVVIAGGSFSGGGDSGSLIVTADTSAPLALLFAGSPTSTVGNPILDSTDSTGKVAKGVLSAFNNGTAPTVVGTSTPHAVSCDPTAQAQSAAIGAQSLPVSAQQQQLARGVRDRHAVELMASDSAIRSVDIGASSDAPGQAALVLHMTSIPRTRISTEVEGIRTRMVYDEGVALPALDMTEFNRGLLAKDNQRSHILQSGIQGVGVGRSDDAPGEAAIVIYTIKGQAHAPIPAVINGVRTKIIDDEHFRASGWNPQFETHGACGKTPAKVNLKAKLKPDVKVK